MAEKKAAKKTTVKGASFVSSIVEDPGAPPQLLLLTGFLGPSSIDDHTRLYLDAGLGTFVDIPDDAIHHTQEQSAEVSPLGAAYVWIDRNAELSHPSLGQDSSSDDSSDTEGASQVNQAAFPTVPASQCLTVPIVCCPLPAGAQGAGGFQANAQAGFPIPTIPASQCLTIPVVCCPLPAGQAQAFAGAQGQAAIPTIPASQCLTVPVVCCPLAAGQAQAPAYQTSAGAQAFPTIPVSRCASVPIVCC